MSGHNLRLRKNVYDVYSNTVYMYVELIGINPNKSLSLILAFVKHSNAKHSNIFEKITRRFLKM